MWPVTKGSRDINTEIASSAAGEAANWIQALTARSSVHQWMGTCLPQWSHQNNSISSWPSFQPLRYSANQTETRRTYFLCRRTTRWESATDWTQGHYRHWCVIQTEIENSFVLRFLSSIKIFCCTLLNWTFHDFVIGRRSFCRRQHRLYYYSVLLLYILLFMFPS